MHNGSFIFSSGTDLTAYWKTHIFPASNLFSSNPSVSFNTDQSVSIKMTVVFLFPIPANSQLCVHSNISAQQHKTKV